MLKFLLAVLSFLLLNVTSVFASGFQLKAIGALDVTGAVSKEWWYSNVNPRLSGITTAGSSVTVTIDSVDYSATVDGSGNWTYSPTTLSDGDHTVVVSSSAGSQTFTLHIGANIPATITAPVTSTTPVVGTWEVTLALWLGAGVLLVSGILLFPGKQSV